MNRRALAEAIGTAVLAAIRDAGFMVRTNCARGDGNPKAKLSRRQRAAIRSSTKPIKALVAQYGVHRETISRLRRDVLWKTDAQ